MNEDLSVELRGQVLQITLATSDGRNEITDAMLAELTTRLREPPENLAAIVLRARERTSAPAAPCRCRRHCPPARTCATC